jgi:alanine-glyoxylate transaminase/serine-glyoxylate transaminase/serine-pyruvate transaminase
VLVVKAEWGTGVPVERYQEILAADSAHEIKAVLATQNETATGVSSDIAAVRTAMDAAGHPALLYVDGVSSIASIDFRMDEWGVDLAVSGSQKGFMLPAGLAIVAVSQKALEARPKAKLARCFFDFDDMIKTNKTGYFPYTPSMPMLHGLRVAVDRLLEEGLENVFARHYRLAEGVRRAVTEGWQLRLCAKEPKWQSDTVSTILVPAHIDGAEVVKRAAYQYNLSLGAGLAQLAGKAFRIGHVGDLNELMLCGAISGAEMVLRDLGLDLKPGSGVGAATDYWQQNKQESVLQSIRKAA